MVTSGRKASLPIIKDTKSKLMVGCGGTLPGQRVIIVDPESLTELKDGQVGEIWVSGPSVAKGYWNRPEATDQIFNAYLSDNGEGPFLRTEDLGFIEDGELYITGRIKDLIIIRGLNHYPQDIEWTVERCHAALRPGCGAAFTVDAEGEERLVIVQEIDTRKEAELDQVIETIREAVTSEHELQVYAVALIKPRQISKTSSGKIQRRDSRRKFLDGTLDAVAEWRAAASEEIDASDLLTSPWSAEAINSWLVSQVAAKVGVASSDVHMDQPLARYGLDSLMAVELAHSIETRSRRYIADGQLPARDEHCPTRRAHPLAFERTPATTVFFRGLKARTNIHSPMANRACGSCTTWRRRVRRTTLRAQ